MPGTGNLSTLPITELSGGGGIVRVQGRTTVFLEGRHTMPGVQRYHTPHHSPLSHGDFVLVTL